MPLDTGSWYPTSLAEALTHTPLRILFVIVVAVGARLLVVHMIRRTARLAIARPAARKGASAQRRSQRLGALASLASSVVTGMFAVITLMIVLAELDFNVTSLIAGSSLVAAMLSFGMQSVIKDLLSGVFLLSEDQLGVGDWVMLEGGGSASGQVIEVGLRITRLRLTDGTVVAVRNGELLRVTNYSQGGPDQLPEAPEVGAT